MRYIIYPDDGSHGEPYVEFDDGRRIAVHGELERLITRLLIDGGVGGRRPEEIKDIEDLAATLERYCLEMAEVYAQAAKRVRPALLEYTNHRR
jgi:hypothetical protein